MVFIKDLIFQMMNKMINKWMTLWLINPWFYMALLQFTVCCVPDPCMALQLIEKKNPQHFKSLVLLHFMHNPTSTQKTVNELLYFWWYSSHFLCVCVSHAKKTVKLFKVVLHLVKGYLSPLGFSISTLIYVTEEDRSTLHSSFFLLITPFPPFLPLLT